MEIGWKTCLFLFVFFCRNDAKNRFYDGNMCGIPDIRLKEPPEPPELRCPGDSEDVGEEGSGSGNEQWPWAGRITNTEDGQHYLGVIVASDTIIGDPKIRSISVTEDKLEFSVIHEETDEFGGMGSSEGGHSFIPSKTKKIVHSSAIRSVGVGSHDNVLTYTLLNPIPPQYFRPVCLPPPGYISKMVKATTCENDIGALTKVKMDRAGEIHVSSIPLVDGTSCSLGMLKSEECVAHIMAKNDNPTKALRPDRKFLDSRDGQNKYTARRKYHTKANTDYYKCHVGAVKAARDCNLNEIIQEAKCSKTDRSKCLGITYQSGAVHKDSSSGSGLSDIEKANLECSEKIQKEYGKCVVRRFKDEMKWGMDNYWAFRGYEGINCLHDYIPTPPCAKSPTKPGLKPLGDEWAVDPCKFYRGSFGGYRTKAACLGADKNKYLKMKPYEKHFSMAMYESIDNFGANIETELKCNTCSGSNICIDMVSGHMGTDFLFWFDSCRNKWFFLGTQKATVLSPSSPYPDNCKPPHVYRNMEETAQIIRDQVAGKVQNIDLYPKPVIVVLGATGVGKSTTSNSLIKGNGKLQRCFRSGSGVSSKTKVTQWRVGRWLGSGACFTMVDTPGTSDTSGGQQDYENIKELTTFLKTDLKQIDIFLVMFKEMDFRYMPEMKKAIDIFVNIFGDSFWKNMATEFTFWDYNPTRMRDRYNEIAQSFELKEAGDQCFRNSKEAINNGGGSRGLPSPDYPPGPDYSPPDYSPPDYSPPDYSPPDYSPPDYSPPDYSPPDYSPPDYSPPDHSLPDLPVSSSDEGNDGEVGITDKMMCALISSIESGKINEEIFHNQVISDGDAWKQLKRNKNYRKGGIKGSITDLEYEKADYVSRFVKHNKWTPVYQQDVSTIPSLFFHPLWDLESPRECQRFKRETSRLMKIANEMEPFVCSAKCTAPEEFFIGTPKILEHLDVSTVDVKYENQLFTLTCTIWNGVAQTHLAGSEVIWAYGWTHIDTTGINWVQSIETDRYLKKSHINLEVKFCTKGDIGLYQCAFADTKLSFATASKISSSNVAEGSVTLTCNLDLTEAELRRRESEIKWYKAEILSSDRQLSDRFSISFQPSEMLSISQLTMNFNNGQPRYFEKTFACKSGASGFSNNITTTISKNAEWANWQRYSSCSKSCQAGPGLEGKKTRKRSCIDSRHNGKTCATLMSSEPDSETVSCNTICCPVNGILKQWTIWKPCMNMRNLLERQTCTSKGGEAGIQSRTRVCEPPSCKGNDCDEELIQKRECNGYHKKPCPIDGGWGNWGPFTKCIMKKGECSGLQTKTRECNNPKPEHNGRFCEGASTDSISCTELDKCPVDCHCNSWTSWGHCSLSCGSCGNAFCNDQGTQQKSRACSKEKNGGESCAHKYGDVLGQTRKCKNLKHCKIDGRWSAYTGRSLCDSKTGKRKRTRNCIPPNFGGLPCIGDREEIETCPVNCQCSGIAWSDWTHCSGSCGDGQREKKRTCTASKNGGIPCHKEIGGRLEYAERVVEKCTNIRRCPKMIAGEWSDWKGLSDCNVECGGGTKRNTRDCLFPGTTGTSSDFDSTYDRKTPCIGAGAKIIGDDPGEEICNAASCAISTLFFLMDTTGSFSGVDQNTALTLGKGIMTELKKRAVDVPRFRIVQINDPNPDPAIGPVITAREEFEKKLENLYKQSHFHGGDWPERSTKAIELTVNRAKANAVVCLFTDAATHDLDLETKILTKLRDKEIYLYIFLTPDYSYRGSSFRLYQRLSRRHTYIMDKTDPSTAALIIEKALTKKNEGRCWTYAGPSEWENSPNECYFPFSFKGKTYTECTTVGKTQPWCATKVLKDPSNEIPVISKKGGAGWEGWGYCGNCLETGVDDRCKAGNHVVLNQAWRAVKSSVSSSDKSDVSLKNGWYKFDVPGTKNTIPQHFTGVPPVRKCGGETFGRIELPPSGKMVSHKEIGIKEFLVCFDLNCDKFKQVKVLWCPPHTLTGTPFYIYELKKLADRQAYCVE